MKYALCHYSLHRTWKDENLTCLSLAELTKELGFEAIDFHVRLLGDLDKSREDIPAALAATGLELSGLSLGNNFNLDGDAALQEQIDSVIAGIHLSAAVKAPVSRIFGGHLAPEDRKDESKRRACFSRIIEALKVVTAEAEKAGVILALENHGGLPASAAEQIEVIEAVNSPNLRATIDVGNFMAVGEHGHESLEKVVHLASYIHFKDNSSFDPVTACTLGDGLVDLGKCLEILEQNNYDGYVAIEYEGSEEERTGIRRSMEHLNGLSAAI